MRRHHMRAGSGRCLLFGKNELYSMDVIYHTPSWHLALTADYIEDGDTSFSKHFQQVHVHSIFRYNPYFLRLILLRGL